MHSAGQNTYRNISDALRRLRSDHEYFSLYPNTSQWIGEKIKLSVKVVTTIWITTNFRITFHFYFLLRLFNEFHVKLQNNIQLSFHDQPQHDKHGSRKLCEAKEIYRRYIGPSCTRSAVDLKRYSNISQVYRSWLHSLGSSIFKGFHH